MFVYAIIFELPEMAKNEILDFSGPTSVSYGNFIQYFVCKCSFREISMIKMVIWDQSKKLKIQKSKIHKLLRVRVISSSILYVNVVVEKFQ